METTLDETVAVTELTVAATAGSDEAEPETGQLLLDMTSSAIEARRRQRRRQCDDASSDADRETALMAHVNSDEIAQLSSDSCQNSKQYHRSQWLYASMHPRPHGSTI